MTTKTEPVPATDRKRLRAIVDEVGESRAVALTQIPRATISRVLADLPVRAGTAVILKQRLSEIGKRDADR